MISETQDAFRERYKQIEAAEPVLADLLQEGDECIDEEYCTLATVFGRLRERRQAYFYKAAQNDQNLTTLFQMLLTETTALTESANHSALNFIFSQAPLVAGASLRQRIYRTAVYEIEQLLQFLADVVPQQKASFLAKHKSEALKAHCVHYFQLFELTGTFEHSDAPLLAAKYPLFHCYLQTHLGKEAEFIPLLFNSFRLTAFLKAKMPKDVRAQLKVNQKVKAKFFQTMETLLFCACLDKRLSVQDKFEQKHIRDRFEFLSAELRSQESVTW